MFVIPLNLIERLLEIHPSTLQLNLHKRESVDEQCHVIPILIPPNLCHLLRDLILILAPMIHIKKPNPKVRFIVSLQNKSISQLLRLLKPIAAIEMIQYPRKLPICEYCLIKHLKLFPQIPLHRRTTLQNNPLKPQPLELFDEGRFKLLFRLMGHRLNLLNKLNRLFLQIFNLELKHIRLTAHIIASYHYWAPSKISPRFNFLTSCSLHKKLLLIVIWGQESRLIPGSFQIILLNRNIKRSPITDVPKC